MDNSVTEVICGSFVVVERVRVSDVERENSLKGHLIADLT